MKIKTFKDLRRMKGLTQEQASKKLDITKEYLSMIENSTRNPSDKLKEKMSKLYQVSIAEIYSAIKKQNVY